MHDPNYWLVALAFVLGLLLTFALTVRRVKREVPVTAKSEPPAKTPAAEPKTAESKEEPESGKEK